MIFIIRTFLLQLAVLIMIVIGLDFIKRLLNRFVNCKFKALDVVPFLTLYDIHALTINSHGFSTVPVLIIGWATLGLILLSGMAFMKHSHNYRRFWVNLWRVGDLYLLIAWIIIGVKVI